MKMRTLIACIISIGFLGGFWTAAQASELNQEEGIFPNHSADWVRTLNRNASTDVDAAFYNPAGLAFMERKGLHVQFSSQTLYVKRIHSMKYKALFADSTSIGGSRVGKLTDNYSNPFFLGTPKEYDASVVAPVLPGFDIAYKGDRFAVYFDVAVTQAAPDLTFPQGLAIMDYGTLATTETLGTLVPQDLYGYARKNFARRTEYYVGGTVGASYAILDWLAAALGVRYIYAMGNQSLGVKNFGVFGTAATARENPWLVDVDVKGHGAGLILGMDFKYKDLFNIGLKYEYYFPMVLDKHTNKFQAPGTVTASGQLNIFLDSWAKLPFWEVDPLNAPNTYTLRTYLQHMNPDTIRNVGNKLRVTYPQTLAGGFSIKLARTVRAETSGEISLRPFVNLGGKQKNWNIGYRVGQCFEWFFVPRAAVSVGYLYNNFGIKKTSKYSINARRRNEVDPFLTSHTIGGGFKIIVTDWLDIDLGAMYSIFKKEITRTAEFTNVTFPTLHYIDKKLDERRWSIAIGLTAHLFGDKVKKEQDSI